MEHIRVGIDIGGTFTDLVFLSEKGERYFGKTLTTYPDPSIGVLKGLDETLNKYGFSYEDIEVIIHGTTLVVNALIERKGVKTALITTKGFRDQLEIGNESRYDIYDLFLDKPEPLIPRNLRFTVNEKMLANGEVLTDINEQEVKDLFMEIKEKEVEAVAVCLLHSYKNNVNEKKILNIAQEVAPEIKVSISSDVSPEIREFERTSTTAANVYVQPIVERYLQKLEGDLSERGFSGQFHMMLSSGGTCSIETACRFPIRILESGPVGGSMAGSFFSKLHNLQEAVIFDMGGTTAKASFIEDGAPVITNDFEVGRENRFTKGSGIPVKIPTVDMIEIGAGGGSIAHIDQMDLLKVGPRSAGSDPGPACYQKGGALPTITDADLVLGYLNPDYFLGGEMKLDVDASYKAIEEHVAKPLGLSVEEAAWGIHRVVNENMANAARIHAVEKGKELTNYPLISMGGAGPVHVNNVAKILGIPTIIAPVGAGVCSAFGFLSTPLSFDFVRSHHERLDQLDWSAVTKLFKEMEEEGRHILGKAGLEDTEINYFRSCEMRYVGQTHEIKVEIPNGELSESSLDEIIASFEKEYKKLYSEASSDVPLEFLNLRVVVQGPAPNLNLNNKTEKNEDAPAPVSERNVYYDEYSEYRMTPVYNRNQLKPGIHIAGPAIIEERESTLVVIPGYDISVDPYLNLVLEAKEDN